MKKRSKIPRVVIDIKPDRESDRRILAGIAQYAAMYGPWEFIMRPLRYTSMHNSKINPLWFADVEADGIIARGLANIDYIRETGLPAIIGGVYREDCEGFTCLKTDSQSIAELAAQHLLDCGFTHFAFCGFADIDWSIYRQNAFTNIIKKNGYEVSSFPALAPELTNTPLEKSELKKWIKSLPKPTGIMACNDDRALQVVEAAKMADILVPDDVAVLGVDNDSMVCGFSNPPLSSVDVDFETAGFKVSKILADMMLTGKKVEEVVYASSSGIEHRRSTDTLVIDDKIIVKALQFIRQHPASPIQVIDVAEHCNLSRRVLEKRFRKVLNRTIFQELKKVRVLHLCKLLKDTNESISEIASRVRFTDVEHFSRYFREAVGVSPTEYRKKWAMRSGGEAL